MPGADEADVVRLLAADPDVPGLRLLLDDEALTVWVAARLGVPAGTVTARRSYLRWKPGAGGVARVRLTGVGTGPAAGPGDDLFVAVWHRDSAAKLDKTVLHGGDAVTAVDRDALAVLGPPSIDRDLPALRRLLAPGARHAVGRLDPVDEAARRRLLAAADGSEPRTLAWKPQRRWVGALGSRAEQNVVLRAYRPRALPVVRSRYRAVGRALGATAPALLGANPHRGLLAVTQLPGRTLDQAGPSGQAVACHAAGELLARLHGASLLAPGVGTLGPDEECEALQAAAATAALLAPDAGAELRAADVVDALRALPRADAVLLHGDLSADQVVVGPTGQVGLIDLDEAVVGPASYDLAGIAASWWLADPGTAADRFAALLAGYSGLRDVPGQDELRVRTAAHLLRRAPEAFRSGRSGWGADVRSALQAASRVAQTDGALL